MIDFAGFRSMVDAVGGIDVDIATPRRSGFARGLNHMDGELALVYVRDRTGVATGERARRQQNALRAILDKAASSDTLTDPVQLYDFLDAASHSVGVDDTLSNGGMRALALKLSDLRPADVLFLRAPVASLGRDGAGMVVQLDPARAPELWTAVAAGNRERLRAAERPGRARPCDTVTCWRRGPRARPSPDRVRLQAHLASTGCSSGHDSLPAHRPVVNVDDGPNTIRNDSVIPADGRMAPRPSSPLDERTPAPRCPPSDCSNRSLHGAGMPPPGHRANSARPWWCSRWVSSRCSASRSRSS